MSKFTYEELGEILGYNKQSYVLTGDLTQELLDFIHLHNYTLTYYNNIAFFKRNDVNVGNKPAYVFATRCAAGCRETWRGL